MCIRDRHRAVQRAAAKAAEAALRLRVRAGVASFLPSVHRADEEIQTGTGGSSDPAERLRVVSASVTRFDAAMRREPTTTGYAAGASDPTRDEGAPVRSGWLLRLELRCGAVGWGEASPLPGLSAETHAEAGAQLAALAALLDGSLSASNTSSSGGGGVLLPAELPLLGGAVARWLARDVGVADVDALLPSALSLIHI